jgi:CheY-like chemotaxis protein
MARIFEPFFTTKGIDESTGMGLAIVQRIVANHDGLITVSSQVGHGTTFDLYFPLVDRDTTQASTPIAPLPCHQERILFVEDEALLASLRQDMLGRLGYTAVACTSSHEALATFEEAPHDFDLVVTDHPITWMTSEDFTRELRRIRPDIPIIICTSFYHTMTAEKARTLGINACLTKPLTTRDLAGAIRRVLAQRVA